MTDLTLEIDNGYFNYRVGAIIIENSKILMVKNQHYPYYYSVGGRVQFGETSEEAVLREAYEETKLTFQIDRLAFIHENFFTGVFQGNKPFHEISMFYIMKPNDEIQNATCDSIGIDGGEETLHWLPIDKLVDYPVYPEFFKAKLSCMTKGVEHCITKNPVTPHVDNY